MVEDVKPRSAIHEIFVLLDSVQEQLEQIRERARQLQGESGSDES